MRTALALCTTLLVLSGCSLLGLSDGDESLRLFTDREAYTLADTAQVWFQNDEREPVTLSLCDSFLERQVGASWEPVLLDRGCALILLAPSTESVVGREVVLGEYVEDGFKEGAYRFSGIVTFVEEENAREKRLVSNAFRLSE